MHFILFHLVKTLIIINTQVKCLYRFDILRWQRTTKGFNIKAPKSIKANESNSFYKILKYVNKYKLIRKANKRKNKNK